MNIKTIVVCRNSQGEPDLFPVLITCETDQFNNGDHYDAACRAAMDNGYDGVMVAADEHDPLFRKITLVRWEAMVELDIR